ncbi:MAG: alanine:cation symporter family protein, partial [Gemmatimonadota bacterium]
WISGLVTATVVGLVIIGGIKRIGKVTGILAPIMAGVYVLGALLIIGMNYQQVIPAFGLIFSEAFSPSAGVAGTGVGAFLMTMMYGVQRGLFSNEAGQGSAPIAHAAAKTDEPVSEGVVALLEPFIDTICICTMTALVIIVTGVWDDRIPTQINISAGAVSYVDEGRTGRLGTGNPPPEIEVRQGIPMEVEGYGELAWNNVPVEEFFTDPDMTMPFTGTIVPGRGVAVDTQGREYGALYGGAVETAAPLTMLGFRRGLAPLGDWGHYIVLFAVLLFGVSTAIAWSYYGDRCAFYLFGEKAVLPYKLVFVVMHFIGAVIPLAVAWTLGDFLLGIVIIPNLIAIVLLSPKVAELTKSYFERKPWLENAEVHRRVLEEKRRKTSGERT